MKPIHGRVIKSEDVRLVNKSGKRIPKSGGAPGDDGASGLTDDTMTTSDLETLKEIYLKKIRSAEQQSHEKGLSAGILKGRELEKKETLVSVQAVNALIYELSKLKQNILEVAEEQILQLVLAVTQKVIHMEVKTNREIIQNVLKAAMRSIIDRENMKVRVHPQDFQYIQEIKSDFLQSFDGIKNIVFEEDASILRGGAIIETIFGEVDARLDHQYNEIKSSMTTFHNSR